MCVCKLLVTLASGVSKWTAQRQISLRSEEDISLHFKSDIVHLFQNLELHLWREQSYSSSWAFCPISQLVRSPHTLMTWVIVSGLFWIITVKANACWPRLTQAESNYSRSRKHIWHSHQHFFFQCFLTDREWIQYLDYKKNSEFNHLSTTKNIQMSSFCISYFNDICEESASDFSALADWVSSEAGHPGGHMSDSFFCFMRIDMFFKNNLLRKRIEAL